MMVKEVTYAPSLEDALCFPCDDVQRISKLLEAKCVKL